MNLKKIKLVFIFILLITIMLTLNSNINAYNATNFNPEYATTTSNVNLRKTANLEPSSIVFTIPNNTNIQIVGSLDNFYIVRLQDNRVGFISKDFVNIGDMTGNFSEYTNLDKYFVTVNSNSTNLRSGPSTNFQIYDKLNEGNRLEVIGKVNNFLLVITENNTIGMIREDLVTKEFNISDEEIKEKTEELLNLINAKREENGLIKLQTSPRLEEIAKLKSEDMVKNNYFAHESPTYGNPFDMMKNFGITYKTAGENLAGNSTIDGAFNSWMESEAHKQNILSKAYNYVGIGITPSERYGYVIVVMFIGI